MVASVKCHSKDGLVAIKSLGCTLLLSSERLTSSIFHSTLRKSLLRDPMICSISSSIRYSKRTRARAW